MQVSLFQVRVVCLVRQLTAEVVAGMTLQLVDTPIHLVVAFHANALPILHRLTALQQVSLILLFVNHVNTN